jgi:hypothetical protein
MFPDESFTPTMFRTSARRSRVSFSRLMLVR